MERSERMSAATDKYETVIGLEVHAQLLTKSKMFSESPNQFGAEPNSLIGPVCSGQPGSLPMINQTAIELGVRAAVALHCTIHEESVFARKHYFYPDLPKGYQISQYEKPYSTGGYVEFALKDGTLKRVGLVRIHFEEDAGKSIHAAHGTLVDLNRAGVPLIEIVSEPEMRSPEEAGQYLRKLRSILRYANICDGNMERGNFRCDANVSLRLRGAKAFGTRVELKNINSFRFVEKAIEYEVERQAECLDRGEKIIQQTRSWNSAKGITETMREKEMAHDYRYFPDPDLPPLIITSTLIDRITQELPELPDAKRARFMKEYELNEYNADVLTASQELAEYYEKVAKGSGNAKSSANWVMNELLGRLNAGGKEIDETPVSAEHLASLIQQVDSGKISGKIAKTVFDEMLVSSKSPEVIIGEKGFVQISDASALELSIRKIIDANPSEVAAYKGGKTKLLGFFVGQVMKETKGQANPGMVNDLVKKLLDG
jgi:aspartyl-tRNA(Asn)/glutamyl-tRNA(Gln) amidotransferase subunit B